MAKIGKSGWIAQTRAVRTALKEADLSLAEVLQGAVSSFEVVRTQAGDLYNRIRNRLAPTADYIRDLGFDHDPSVTELLRKAGIVLDNSISINETLNLPPGTDPTQRVAEVYAEHQTVFNPLGDLSTINPKDEWHDIGVAVSLYEDLAKMFAAHKFNGKSVDGSVTYTGLKINVESIPGWVFKGEAPIIPEQDSLMEEIAVLSALEPKNRTEEGVNEAFKSIRDGEANMELHYDCHPLHAVAFAFEQLYDQLNEFVGRYKIDVETVIYDPQNHPKNDMGLNTQIDENVSYGSVARLCKTFVETIGLRFEGAQLYAEENLVSQLVANAGTNPIDMYQRQVGEEPLEVTIGLPVADKQTDFADSNTVEALANDLNFSTYSRE